MRQSFLVVAGILCLVPAIEVGSAPLGASARLPWRAASPGAGIAATLFLPTFIPGCELNPPMR